MLSTRSPRARALDFYGILSTTTGVIRIAFAVGGQLWAVEKFASFAMSGHPEGDGLMLATRVPGFLCAALSIVLGTAGLDDRESGMVWSTAGVVLGTIALICTLSGLPVGMMEDPRVVPESP